MEKFNIVIILCQKKLYSVWNKWFSPNNVLIASDQIESNIKQQRNDKNITEILWSMEMYIFELNKFI